MSIIETTIGLWDFCRQRTLATLAEIEKHPQGQAILGWRPGPGRAHIAWQLMHIAVTEELFATERFLGTAAAWPDLASRFRGGSTPDDDIPSAARIRELFEASRAHLLETVRRFTVADLDTVPVGLVQRNMPLRTALQIIAWHEAHHQGQAHLTFNLWKAAQGSS